MKRIDHSQASYVPYSEQQTYQRRRLNDGSAQEVKPTPFDDPENVAIADIVSVAGSALKAISPFDDPVVLRQKVLNATTVWWKHIPEINDIASRSTVHKLCIQLIMRTQILGTNFRGSITCKLSDDSQVQITPASFDILCMASPVILRMFSNEMKESTSNQFHLDISQEVFSEIVNKLLDPDFAYSEDINKLELLAAAHYLEIAPLKKEIFESLDDVIKEAKPEMLAEIITLYKTFVDDSYTEGDRIALCLSAIAKIALNDDAIIKAASELDFKAINALIPGLKFCKPGLWWSGVDLNLIKNQLATVNTTIQDNYTDLRRLLAAAELIKSGRAYEVTNLLQNNVAYMLPTQYILAYACNRLSLYNNAIECLDACTKRNGNLWWIWSLWGEIELKAGHPVPAQSYFEKANGLNSTSLEVKIGFAKLYHQTEQLDLALRSAENILTSDPMCEEALLLKARLVICHNMIISNYDPKITIDTVLEHNVTSGQALFLQGVYYSKREEYLESCKSFDKCIQFDGNFADAYRERGLVKFKQKKFDEAVIDFQKAAEHKPEDLEVWIHLAFCQRSLDRLSDANHSINHAMSLNNQDVHVLLEKGRLELALGYYDSAIGYLNRVQQNTRLSLPLYSARIFEAKAWFFQGNLNMALSKLGNDTPPSDLRMLRWEYYFDKGKIYLAQNDLNHAIKFINLALEIKKDAELLCLRAQVYLNRKSKGMKKKAKENFEIALALKPGFPLALEGIQLVNSVRR